MRWRLLVQLHMDIQILDTSAPASVFLCLSFNLTLNFKFAQKIKKNKQTNVLVLTAFQNKFCGPSRKWFPANAPGE